MKRFWKRYESGLEDELRGLRAEPRDEFVASVADRVRTPRKAYGRIRLGVGVALTIALLAALAPVGGASYAGRAAVDLVSAAAHVLGPGSRAGTTGANSPSHDQYKKPKKHKKKAKRKAKKRGVAGVRRGPHFTG